MRQVNNINDFLKIVEQINVNHSLFFRGQLEKYNGFTPTIARDAMYLKNETNIVYETDEKKSDAFNGLDTPIKKLAKMQHYGIPTRLVDLTTNPLVALYFAVENTEDESSGNIYIFDEESYSTNSKEAKLLSILPYVAKRDENSIVVEYKKQYNEMITPEEVSILIERPIFIEYSNELEFSNPRLFEQSGTFVVCTNKCVDGRITDELVSLECFHPVEVIRVPFEYKREVKQRLDTEYGINYIKTYPELSPFADYIKNKYKTIPVPKGVLYRIVDSQDTSTAFAKRKSITVLLNEQVEIDRIKDLVKELIKKDMGTMDVVWVNVAKDSDDLISTNWIFRCQWINPSLDEKFRPISLPDFEDGYYWAFSKSYSIDADVMQAFFEEDDKSLLLAHKNIWNDFLKAYVIIKNTLREAGWERFVQEVNLKKVEISKLYMKLQDFGHSHNKEFDDFLCEISNCVSDVDNIRYVLGNNSISAIGKQHLVDNVFQRSDERIRKIDEEIYNWECSFKI